MPDNEDVGEKKCEENVKTVVIINNGKLEIYKVPEHVFNDLPHILHAHEVSDAIDFVEARGTLVETIKPDYTIVRYADDD